MTYYFDMDGVLANFHKDFVFAKRAQQACNRQWIANLEPFVENVALVASLIEAGENVYILTAAANEAAKQGKIDWLAKYLPMITLEKFICIVGSGKKIDHIREDGMLIDDDYKKNLRAWEKAGQPIYWVKEKGEKIVFKVED